MLYIKDMNVLEILILSQSETKVQYIPLYINKKERDEENIESTAFS